MVKKGKRCKRYSVGVEWREEWREIKEGVLF